MVCLSDILYVFWGRGEGEGADLTKLGSPIYRIQGWPSYTPGSSVSRTNCRTGPLIFLYLIFKNRLYAEGLQYVFYTGAFGHFFTLDFTSKKDVLTQMVLAWGLVV